MKLENQSGQGLWAFFFFNCRTSLDPFSKLNYMAVWWLHILNIYHLLQGRVFLWYPEMFLNSWQQQTLMFIQAQSLTSLPKHSCFHDENLNVETHCRTFQLILPLALATWLLSLGYPKTDFLRGDRKRQIQDRRFSWDLYCDPSFLPWCRTMLTMVIVNLWPWDNKSEGQGHHDKVCQKDKQKSFELVWYHRLWITVMRPCVCWFLVKPVYITQLLQWTPMPSNSSFILWQGDDVR